MRFIIAMLLALPATAWAAVSTTNPLDYDPTRVDVLTMWDDAEEFGAGDFDGAQVEGDEITLTSLTAEELQENRAYPLRGRWTSPSVTSEFAFTDVLPSWNPVAPEGTGMQLDVRVHMVETGEWSPWLYIGRWGQIISRPDRTVEFDGGTVNVDILNLDEPANAYQLRVTMLCFDPVEQPLPRVRRVAAVHSGPVEDEALRAALQPTTEIAGDPTRVIEVPHLGQGLLGRPLSGQCCSPTSLTMVLRGLGEDIDLRESSMAVYDPDYNIFGNWGRNVAYAGSLGRDAWLTRFNGLDQVKALVAQGQPVIASVSIGEGDITGVDYTGGHLVVIRGFTPEGDVIINDPAFTERGGGSIWLADEMANVWFGHGGVAYIIQ